jgi:hypothetical protein
MLDANIELICEDADDLMEDEDAIEHVDLCDPAGDGGRAAGQTDTATLADLSVTMSRPPLRPLCTTVFALLPAATAPCLSVHLIS